MNKKIEIEGLKSGSYTISVSDCIDNSPNGSSHIDCGQICTDRINNKQWYRMNPEPYKYTSWLELPIPINELVSFYFKHK